MATEVGAAYVTLSARTAQLEAGLARANTAIAGFSKKADAQAAAASQAFSTLGRGVKMAGLAVAGGLALSAKSAADFDSQMSNVRAVTGANTKQMQAFRKAALDTSRTTQGFGYTARDVASAQVELGKAGLSVAQITGGAMQASLTLAKAGHLQLGDAAGYTANAMKQFGMGGQQASQVADALATAANATTADVGDFGMALVQGGSAAKAAGISFNQTMTALTALASIGVKSSDAGTSLKTALIQLVKPTKQQAQAARDAGMAFIDQSGKMKDMVSISAMLRERTAGMTQTQRTALFATLAGTDGVRTLLSLYDAGPSRIAKFSAALGKQGTATEMAATMNDNAAGKFKQLIATLQAAGIEIGAAILPPLVLIASAFAKVVGAFTAFKPVAYAAAAAVTALIAAMAVSKVIAFGGAIGAAAKSMGAMVGLGAAAGAATGGAGTAAGAAAGRFAGLAAAIPLVANPIGALTVGVGIGIAALFAMRNEMSYTERIFASAGEAATNYKNAAAAVTQGISAQKTTLEQANNTALAATTAQKAYTTALQNHIGAFAAGRKANETEAQFQARLRSLYVQVTQAKLGLVNAQNQDATAIRAAVDGSSKLRTAVEAEVSTAKTRLDTLRGQQAAMERFGASQKDQAKIASEVASAQAQLGVAEARRTSRLREVEKQQVATREAIKKSSMTDAEKTASLAVVNQEINRTRTALRNVEGTKDPKKKITVDNAQATAALDSIRSLIANLPSFKTITIKAVKEGLGWGAFRGGFAGFAGGGVVRGPAGRDVIPAMLTAGEVVLTKQQQAMVNGGMNIRDAIRRTGGAFAKGGFVAPKRNKGEGDKEYRARVKAARAKWKSSRMDAMAPAFQAVGDAMKTSFLDRFDRDTRNIMRGIEKNFTGSGDVAGKSFAQLDKDLANNLKSIEDNFMGTGVVAGLTFKNLDSQMRKAQATLSATFDALTPAEQRLKDMQTAFDQANLQGAITDAQAALANAQQFGDADAIRNAQKALGEAERAEQMSQLQATAEQERALRETQRQTAQDAFDTEWEGKRAELQTQLDGQLEQERTSGANRQAELERQLAERLASEENSRAELRMQREIELEALGANLLAQRGKYLNHFKSVRAAVQAFANKMRISGANIGKSIAEGLDSAKGELRGAAAGLATILSDWLKTRSPSKRGPLSSLDTWMDGFAPALLSGMDTGAIESRIASAVAAPSIISGAGASGGLTINLTVTDQTFAGMSRDQADRVASQIQSALNRRVSIAI